MNRLSIQHRVMLLILIVLLSVLILFIGKLGLADIYAHKSYSTLKKWQLAPFTMSDREWNAIQTSLEKAHHYDPENPEIMMAAGLAHEGRFAFSAVELPEARPARLIALAYYRESVKLRPTWPYGWVDLALVKYRLGEIDDEFYNALNTSAELGPWEPGVQKVIIDIGLHGWSLMNEDAHTLVLNTIKNAAVHSNKGHVNSIIEQLKRYNILYYACHTVGDDPYISGVCSQK
jgi:polysaccharide biosynthesis protein VpsP